MWSRTPGSLYFSQVGLSVVSPRQRAKGSVKVTSLSSSYQKVSPLSSAPSYHICTSGGETTIGKLNHWVILKANFEVPGLVFSCIETKFCKKILVGKL